MIDLKSLTADDLVQLRQMLGMEQSERLSVVRKPLTDLRPQQGKKRYYRPHFEWSAEDDGLQVITDYPRLYWDEQGVERRVDSEDVAVPAAWLPYPPAKAALVDPMVQMQAEFDALSPEDQKFVLDAQKQARLQRLQGLMAELPEADLKALSRKPDAKAKKSA